MFQDSEGNGKRTLDGFGLLPHIGTKRARWWAGGLRFGRTHGAEVAVPSPYSHTVSSSCPFSLSCLLARPWKCPQLLLSSAVLLVRQPRRHQEGCGRRHVLNPSRCLRRPRLRCRDADRDAPPVTIRVFNGTSVALGFAAVTQIVTLGPSRSQRITLLPSAVLSLPWRKS